MPTTISIRADDKKRIESMRRPTPGRIWAQESCATVINRILDKLDELKLTDELGVKKS